MRTKRAPDTEPVAVTQFVAEVGVRIRLMRLARKLTQAELAERADMSRSTLIEIEKGGLRTRFADIARLLWALDDMALQSTLASAAEDPVYQEAVRANLPRFARRSSEVQR
ncbi:MAG TPA: helix-turn-helix transcriptional regulator [Ramlibacter sp.]|nr:helix-turn-helix transcriptional regulator [Ramlibacter sp.]